MQEQIPPHGPHTRNQEQQSFRAAKVDIYRRTNTNYIQACNHSFIDYARNRREYCLVYRPSGRTVKTLTSRRPIQSAQRKSFRATHIFRATYLWDANASDTPKPTCTAKSKQNPTLTGHLARARTRACLQAEEPPQLDEQQVIDSNEHTQNSRNVDFDNPFIRAKISLLLSYFLLSHSRRHTRTLRFYFSLRVHWLYSLSGRVGTYSGPRHCPRGLHNGTVHVA